MGAAGDQLALHQRETVPDGQGAVEGDGGLGPRNRLGADIDLLFHLILPEIALQLSLPLGHRPVDHTEVALFQFTVLDLLVHYPQALGGLGGDDDAAGVPVDAVA